MSKMMFRYFTIADFKEEEAFLRKQHLLGWSLRKMIVPGFYVFDECEKEDYIYQLDFPDLTHQSRLSYIQMFKDFGWEYVSDFTQFSYFRRKNDKDCDVTIFSDDASKIEMIDRIYKRRMLPIIIIFVSVFLPMFINVLNFNSGFRSVLSVFYMTFLFIYIVLIVHCGIKLNKLKKNVE